MLGEVTIKNPLKGKEHGYTMGLAFLVGIESSLSTKVGGTTL